MAPVIPTWFEEQLERDFRGELRIRWSEKRKEWHIEQKVGRATAAPPRWMTDTREDRVIRARDGYAFVAAVQPRPSRPCPQCHLPLDVPVLRFLEIRCEYCGYKGASGRLVLAYFPLGEHLLEHLRKHDPTKDSTHKLVKEIDLHNERVELAKERQWEAERQEPLYDYAYSQLPSVGYTGRERAWR